MIRHKRGKSAKAEQQHRTAEADFIRLKGEFTLGTAARAENER